MDNEGNAAGIVDQQNIASLLAAMKDMEHRSNERMERMERMKPVKRAVDGAGKTRKGMC